MLINKTLSLVLLAAVGLIASPSHALAGKIRSDAYSAMLKAVVKEATEAAATEAKTSMPTIASVSTSVDSSRINSGWIENRIKVKLSSSPWESEKATTISLGGSIAQEADRTTIDAALNVSPNGTAFAKHVLQKNLLTKFLRTDVLKEVPSQVLEAKDVKALGQGMAEYLDSIIQTLQENLKNNGKNSENIKRDLSICQQIKIEQADDVIKVSLKITDTKAVGIEKYDSVSVSLSVRNSGVTLNVNLGQANKVLGANYWATTVEEPFDLVVSAAKIEKQPDISVRHDYEGFSSAKAQVLRAINFVMDLAK